MRPIFGALSDRFSSRPGPGVPRMRGARYERCPDGRSSQVSGTPCSVIELD